MLWFLLGHQPLLSQAELLHLGIKGHCMEGPWLRVEKNTILAQFNNLTTLQNLLGGTIKITEEILNARPHYSLSEQLIEIFTRSIIPNNTAALSLYPTTTFSLKKYFNLMQEIKKKTGIHLLYNHTALQLSTKEIHQLLTRTNSEYCCIEQSGLWTVTKTITIQDAISYQQRDVARPHLLKKTGMMPPKLAQILINLARGNNKIHALLDPFSGAGTILQEALLQGISTYGVDIDPRTVTVSRQNLQWLHKQYQNRTLANYHIKHGDARDPHVYKTFATQFDAVVTEGELGKNFTHLPTREQITKQITTVIPLYQSAFKAFVPYLKKNSRVVCCFPCWQSYHYQVQTISQLLIPRMCNLRLTLVPLLGSQYTSIVYKRPHQFVGREIYIFSKS